MKILDFLGLGKKSEDAKEHAFAAGEPDRQERKEKIPAAVQDSCCGSCGGHGHAAKKERRE